MYTKELIQSFSNLSLSEKRREFGRELSESYILIDKLLSDITNSKPLVEEDELDNLYDSNISEDEYLTGLYEDFINYKEILALYLSKVSEDKYE